MFLVGVFLVTFGQRVNFALERLSSLHAQLSKMGIESLPWPLPFMAVSFSDIQCSRHELVLTPVRSLLGTVCCLRSRRLKQVYSFGTGTSGLRKGVARRALAGLFTVEGCGCLEGL